jgi:hypothetical protein
MGACPDNSLVDQCRQVLVHRHGLCFNPLLGWYVQSRYGACIVDSITFARYPREKVFRQDSVYCVPSSRLLFTLQARRQSKQRESVSRSCLSMVACD